jgi:thiamine biosynthesis lipoprotein ApbE
VSQNNIEIVYITHKLAIFSDIFATALFVSPLEKSIDILASVK